MTHARQPLLTTDDLAEYAKVTVKTVYGWNSDGVGPRRIRLGKQVRYRLADVEEWLDGRTIDPPREG